MSSSLKISETTIADQQNYFDLRNKAILEGIDKVNARTGPMVSIYERQSEYTDNTFHKKGSSYDKAPFELRRNSHNAKQSLSARRFSAKSKKGSRGSMLE